MKRYYENYEYGVCNPWDEKLIKEMAECLAETFTGVQVGSAYIKEPMSIAIHLSKEALAEFVTLYIENVSEAGLCTYAKDKETGKIIGALACENFNPKEEPPILEGNLAPINLITQFLWRLDKKFIETVELKTKTKIQDGEYAHPLMLGVRAEKDKKYIGVNLLSLMLERAKAQGYKGAFGEATNLRSQKLVTELLGYIVVRDIEDNPIAIRYDDDEIFHTIPEDIATECCLVYKALDDRFEL